MSKKHPSRSITALGLLVAAVPAATHAAEDIADAGEIELEEYVVTGTRISRAPAETPHPIVSYDAQNLAESGLTNLTEFLLDIPALVGSTATADTSGSGFGIGRVGLNLLNLRNLGTDRTLVLVNGRRHIAGEVGSAAVDINTIPFDLIERIDVLTGGMSAIYGADGVSGVVNFATKRDFSGLALRGQTGLADRGDGGSSLFSVTAGQNFRDGAGNVALSYEFAQDDRISAADRPHVGDPQRAYELVANPADPDDDPALYDYVVMNDIRWLDSSPDSAVDVDGDLTPDFVGSGASYDLGEYLGDGLARGGSSTPLAGYQGDLRARTRRHVVNLLGSYELNDSARLFAEGKYARNQAWNTGQPSFGFYNYINADNPLMPQAIRDAIVPGGVSSWFSDVLGETVPEGVFLTRDHMDFPPRGDRVTRETVRSVVGVEGRLGATRYEASYTYGQSEVEYAATNNRIDERFFAAIDVVDEGEFLGGAPSGVLRCRIDLQPPGTVINPENILSDEIFGGAFLPGGDGSGLPVTFTPGDASGCVPLNLFGESVADQAALDWLATDASTRSRMSHHVVSGSLTGDLGRFFELPGGPLAWAAGAEYRKEKSRSTPDELVQQQLLFGYPLVRPERGSFDVKEVFAEVNLPLLRDAPFAHRLSIGGAVRQADYSTIGSATTWKVDSIWAPVRDIALRATYSQAVRAPNIAELFAPLSGTFERVSDPCGVDSLNLGPAPENREANCAQLLTALGIDPTTFNPGGNTVASGSIPGQLGGNQDLAEETARSWTAGFMLNPSFAPGMNLTFDWYNTRLKNAISYVSADELVALCVDAPTLDNVFCESVTRNPATGFINGFVLLPQNVSRFTASGADLSVDYDFTVNPDWGRFHLDISAGYLDELTFISTPGAPVDDQRNDPYIPKYSASSDLTWTRDAWSVNFGTSFYSKTRRYDATTMAAEPDYVDPRYVWYKASWTHDLQVSYHLRDRGLQFYGGANNLFNAGPDFPSTSYPNGWLGRFLYAGARFEVGAGR